MQQAAVREPQLAFRVKDILDALAEQSRRPRTSCKTVFTKNAEGRKHRAPFADLESRTQDINQASSRHELTKTITRRIPRPLPARTPAVVIYRS